MFRDNIYIFTLQISKAAMLQKGAEYIKQLKAERNQIKEEMESLRQQIECLNNSISYVIFNAYNQYRVFLD